MKQVKVIVEVEFNISSANLYCKSKETIKDWVQKFLVGSYFKIMSARGENREIHTLVGPEKVTVKSVK